jgi:DNA-binding transcriptional ArsR family regulator
LRALPTLDPDARLGAVFGALGDPTRRYLIQRLASTPHATATALSDELPVSRQAVVKHLAVLRDAGLVRNRRAGREARYELEPEPLSEATRWINEVGAQWDRRLARLKRLLES